MDKIKYFKKTIKTLIKEVDACIEIKEDNRMGHYGAEVKRQFCRNCGERGWLIRYNGKKMKTATKLDILMLILHELGHIHYNHSDEQTKPSIRKEYEAEEYAMQQLKQKFPKLYPSALKYIKEYSNHQDKIYRVAFTKLYGKLKND